MTCPHQFACEKDDGIVYPQAGIGNDGSDFEIRGKGRGIGQEGQTVA
jgi:hypothetical protein